jgi:hypothetical protein
MRASKRRAREARVPRAESVLAEAPYATNTELVATVNGDQPGQDGVALVRVGLGTW